VDAARAPAADGADEVAERDARAEDSSGIGGRWYLIEIRIAVQERDGRDPRPRQPGLAVLVVGGTRASTPAQVVLATPSIVTRASPAPA
jgi:hypothetical protein